MDEFINRIFHFLNNGTIKFHLSFSFAYSIEMTYKHNEEWNLNLPKSLTSTQLIHNSNHFYIKPENVTKTDFVTWIHSSSGNSSRQAKPATTTNYNTTLSLRKFIMPVRNVNISKCYHRLNIFINNSFDHKNILVFQEIFSIRLPFLILKLSIKVSANLYSTWFLIPRFLP